MQRPQIAVFVGTSTSWGRRLVQGIFNYTQQHQRWDILIQPEVQHEVPRQLKDGTYDGIIARVSNKAMANKLTKSKLPVINISGLVIDGVHFPRVTTSWGASIKLAENHFQERAIRNFAYVGPTHLAHAGSKGEIFDEILRERSSEYHIFKTDGYDGIESPTANSTKKMVSWLKQLPKPVGIYTWGTQTGRTAASACISSGIPVPHDVAILGSNYDALYYEACHPALSGIVVPTDRVGYVAAQKLSLLMRGKKLEKKDHFILPEKIISGLSTDTLAIADTQMKKAISYLRAHACESIKIDDILRETGIARRSLERRFMKYLGCSPAQEIKRIRIAKARSLLGQGNLSIEEVAEACGYSGYTYFGNIFKQETGISPGRYRSRTRENPIGDYSLR